MVIFQALSIFDVLSYLVFNKYVHVQCTLYRGSTCSSIYTYIVVQMDRYRVCLV